MDEQDTRTCDMDDEGDPAPGATRMRHTRQPEGRGTRAARFSNGMTRVILHPWGPRAVLFGCGMFVCLLSLDAAWRAETWPLRIAPLVSTAAFLWWLRATGSVEQWPRLIVWHTAMYVQGNLRGVISFEANSAIWAALLCLDFALWGVHRRTDQRHAALRARSSYWDSLLERLSVTPRPGDAAGVATVHVFLASPLPQRPAPLHPAPLCDLHPTSLCGVGLFRSVIDAEHASHNGVQLCADCGQRALAYAPGHVLEYCGSTNTCALREVP